MALDCSTPTMSAAFDASGTRIPRSSTGTPPSQHWRLRCEVKSIRCTTLRRRRRLRLEFDQMARGLSIVAQV